MLRVLIGDKPTVVAINSEVIQERLEPDAIKERHDPLKSCGAMVVHRSGTQNKRIEKCNAV